VYSRNLQFFPFWGGFVVNKLDWVYYKCSTCNINWQWIAKLLFIGGIIFIRVRFKWSWLYSHGFNVILCVECKDFILSWYEIEFFRETSGFHYVIVPPPPKKVYLYCIFSLLRSIFVCDFYIYIVRSVTELQSCLHIEFNVCIMNVETKCYDF